MLYKFKQSIANLTDDYIIEVLNDLNVENDKLSNVCYNCVHSILFYQILADVSFNENMFPIIDILYDKMLKRVYEILYSKYPDRFKSDILDLYEIESFDKLTAEL